jgi:hypothetical protein
MEEMVRDAMSYDGYTSVEFAKLQKMVRDMKTPLYPGCNENWTKLFTSLKLLQLKATHHWTDHGFKALLDLLRDMLPEENEIAMTTYEAKKLFALWEWKLKKSMLVRTTVSCFAVTLQISMNAQNVEPLHTNEGMTGVIRKGCTELLRRWHGISH